MVITFFSNFLTHHQLPFCLEMVKKYGDNFKFVSTVKISEERLKLGYKNMDDEYSKFVIKAYENQKSKDKAMKLAFNSDVVIMGSTITDEYITKRLETDKLTFRYYARIFYKGIFSIFDFNNLRTVYNKHFKYRKNKNLYLLCASSYGPNDFNKFKMYINKCFKWGYFPKNNQYNIEKLIENKEKNKEIRILWVGRFIKEKHPEDVIKLANKLNKDKYNYRIQMIGNGEKYLKINKLIKKCKLEGKIEMIGSVDSDKVRNYMEEANIFICTSDRNERWGVVLNEAMNSGCTVIANKWIGGVPFLIKNNENGLAYSSFNDFYKKVINVIKDKNLRYKLSKNAYRTISTIWTASNAANNFETLLNCIQNRKENLVKEGPASNAYPVTIKTKIGGINL